LAIHGAVPRPLPVAQSFVAQLASSFVNRIAPARVGGIALNVRWLVRAGIQMPIAAAAVSVNAIGGFVMHVTLTLVVVLWAGRSGLDDLEMPSTRTVGVGLGIVGAAMAVTYAIPPLRRALRHTIWPRTRQSLEAVTDVATSPRRLLLLLGGSLIVTSCYVAALSLSIDALGASLPLPTVALVYLAGTAIASAAPTPGGLGATEAALAAGLAAMGLDQATAVAAVLLYRLVTFWLPIVPGWLCFTYLRRAERI
jgi:undecaprenyl-diphosphatase